MTADETIDAETALWVLAVTILSGDFIRPPAGWSVGERLTYDLEHRQETVNWLRMALGPGVVVAVEPIERWSCAGYSFMRERIHVGAHQGDAIRLMALPGSNDADRGPERACTTREIEEIAGLIPDRMGDVEARSAELAWGSL